MLPADDDPVGRRTEAESGCERAHDMLHADLVAADEHVLVLALADALATLRGHSKVLAPHGRVHQLVQALVSPRSSAVGHGAFAIQPWRTVQRVGEPAGRMSISSTPTGVNASTRFGNTQ